MTQTILTLFLAFSLLMPSLSRADDSCVSPPNNPYYCDDQDMVALHMVFEALGQIDELVRVGPVNRDTASIKMAISSQEIVDALNVVFAKGYYIDAPELGRLRVDFQFGERPVPFSKGVIRVRAGKILQ